MLDIGTKAPAFTLPDQDGHSRSLAEFVGKWVVLYFYPKDDTAGCTKEACTIAEIYTDFSNLGTTVIGVSVDSPESHRAFREKYHLPFTLLSDSKAKMMESYEAWKRGFYFGKKFLGTRRMTYIIDPQGTIVKAYPNVDPAGHALQLLADLKILIK